MGDAMELLYEAPGLLIGLIGWAATAVLILDSPRLSVIRRRVCLVLAWMIWMIPAFNVLVLRGLLSSDTATLSCGSITLALVLIVSLSWLRPTKQ